MWVELSYAVVVEILITFFYKDALNSAHAGGLCLGSPTLRLVRAIKRLYSDFGLFRQM